MKGHAAKKGKRWYAVVDEPPGPDGKRGRRRWHSGFRTKKEAEAGAVEILGTMQSGAYVSPSAETLGPYLRAWLEAHRINKPLRDSTYHGYRKIIDKYITPRLGAVALQKLRPEHLDAFYAELQRDGRRLGNAALSARTVRHVHIVLRSALAAAVRKGRLASNPADRADAPAPKATEMHVWSALELRAFLEHVRDDRLYAAWLLAAGTGLRRGEVLGLRWKDCDLDSGRLTVTQTLLDVGHKLTFGPPKTDAGRRTVALDAGTVAVLRAHRTRQLEERLACGGDFNDGALVFCRADGDPVHPAWFSRAFDQRVTASRLPAIRLHDLRHTHATIALGAGVNVKVVSERLGHSKIAITLDTYAHVMPTMQEEAAERVAALVFGA